MSEIRAREAKLWSALAMLALLTPQAVLGATRERSLASLSQSGSTAPALHTGGTQILDVSRKFSHEEHLDR